MKKRAVCWRKDSRHGAVISEIANNINLEKGVSLSYSVATDFAIDTLFGMLDYSFDLDLDSMYKIFTEVIESLFAKGRLDGNSILLHFQSECNKELQKSFDYTAVARSNLEQCSLLKKIIIESCEISFVDKANKKYESARARTLKKLKSIDILEQEEYTTIVARISAPNPRTAYKRLMDSVAALQGIINITHKKGRNIFASEKRNEFPTFSLLALGQTTSIHNQDGSLATPGVFYEHDFITKRRFSFSNKKESEKIIKKNLRGIKKSPFRDELISALAKYGMALRNIPDDHRFLRLWATLENVLKASDSRVAIDRASFFYSNAPVASAAFQDLRQWRNIVAHGGTIPVNTEKKNYALCITIERIFNHLIENPMKHANYQEFLQFLSCARTVEANKERMRVLRKAIKYISNNDERIETSASVPVRVVELKPQS